MSAATTAETRPALVAEGAAPKLGRRRRPAPRRVLLYVMLGLLSVFFILPLLWMLSTALKPGVRVYTDSGLIPSHPSLANFRTVLTNTGDTPVLRWLLNSVVTATTGATLTVVLASLSGYAFARIPFPGRSVIFGLMMATFMLPGVMFLVPQYLLVDQLGLYNTIPALVLPGLASVFSVLFMRQFFLNFPTEFEEVASVDGAGPLRTFLRIVVPLSRPALATLAVISFLGYWNDYLWPVVMCESSGCTLPAGLHNLQGTYTADYGLLMAGAAVAAAPMIIVFAISQRWIVQSIADTGLKG